MTSTIDARALTQAGAQALGKGDFAGARGIFEGIIAGGGEDGPVLLGLAVACRGLGDGPATLAALDRLLEREPRHLRGLLMKADHFAEDGDGRAAAGFYRAALRAAPALEQLPPAVAADVRRAEAAVEAYAAEYERHLETALAVGGVDPADPAAARFAQSLDLMLGRKQLFLQQPRHYYFPGLPQIQFYPREPFPWLAALEAAAGDIQAELAALLADGDGFAPYLETRADRPFAEGHGMRDNPDWGAIYLWRDGERVDAVADRCPRTLEAISAAPLCQIDGRTPSILFSRLAPRARIPPHSGFINTRLICHLPLILPGQCGFRVGNETRAWRAGEAWLFDDTIQHEAWNESDEDRVILIFDIWRPELTEAERDMVRALFAAVDSYAGAGQAWGV